MLFGFFDVYRFFDHGFLLIQQSEWHDFIQETYGCLAGAPIERGEQGKYEVREAIR